MPTRLHRYYGAGYLHFLTTSCYQRSALLGTPWSRDLFLEVMEQVRRRYRFVVVGYVVMPEHVHLLFSEPERRDPSVVMKALKQSFARRVLEGSAPLPMRGDHLCGMRRSLRAMFGNTDSTISSCSPRRNGSRSCAICIAIRWCAGLCWSRNSGTGVAIAITPQASGDRYWSMKRRKQNCACAGWLDQIAAQNCRGPWCPLVEKRDEWGSRLSW